MMRCRPLSIVATVALIACLLCCKAEPVTSSSPPLLHPGIIDTSLPGKQVTIIIALSSIVPGGIVGHAGVAVEDTYWDFGPTRDPHLQPLKSIRSQAGPWWDDPDQQWQHDRSLTEVLADLPEKIHPMGSLVAIIQVQVTDTQAHAITQFWQDTYNRMRNREDTYRLTARQCASMVAWSIAIAMQDNAEASERLPRGLHLMSPTRLYESLNHSLMHSAGPDKGEPADITLWQRDQHGLSPWQRADLYEQLALPELPRIRLTYERLKHLPTAISH
ncbi:MAG: hypothetical protein AB8C95_01010 [Phycisphaeraceae bacterium]